MSLMAMVTAGPPQPFSVESVKKVFSSQVFTLRARYKAPSPEAFEVLTEKLNGKAAFYAWWMQDMLPHAERMAPMIQAAEFLSSELRTRIEEHQKSIIPFSMIPMYFNEKLRNELLCLQNAFNAVKDLFDQTSAFRPVQHVLDSDRTGWHGFTLELADLFREAMLPTNPTARFGDNGKSPLAKFIAAVIPKITGETATAEAVSAELRRARAAANGRVAQAEP